MPALSAGFSALEPPPPPALAVELVGVMATAEGVVVALAGEREEGSVFAESALVLKETERFATGVAIVALRV